MTIPDALLEPDRQREYRESPLLGMSLPSHAQLVQNASTLEIRRP
jgi:hypothetical protein